MYSHFILLTNDFVIHHSFIALHVVIKEGDSLDIAQNVVSKVNALLGKNSDFSSQFFATEDKSWKSVVDYDPYFEHMHNIDYAGHESIEEFVRIIKANKILTADDVSEFVLSRVKCTQLKLQKLVYFCYADYLAKTGKPVFAELPVLYQYGPVFESLRNEYKQYHDTEIPSDTSQRRQNIILSRYFAADNKLEIYASFNGTLARYGNKSASELVELTHRENSPWNVAKEENQKYISQETIQKYHYAETI